MLYRTSQNACHWQPLQDDDHLQNYSCPLDALTQAVLLTLQNHHSGYQFPLTGAMKMAGKRLISNLSSSATSDNLAISALHTFIYPFFSAQVAEGEYNKWNEVLECFLAIYCLNPDGNFTEASGVTQLFAILKYLCWGTVLYEALGQASHFDNNAYQ